MGSGCVGRAVELPLPADGLFRFALGLESVAGNGLARRRRVVIALPNFVELLYFFRAQRLSLAEHVRHERDLGEMLHGFHFHESAFEGRAKGHHTMVCHQNRVVVWNQWFERIG